MPEDPRSSPQAPDPVPDDRGPLPDPDIVTTPDDEPPAREHRLRTALLIAGAVALAVVVVVLGIVNPRPSSGVTTDRLGPAQGERVDDYLAGARASLDGADTDAHWALVSFTDYLAPPQIPAAAAGLRISGVIQHVPINRVQTPVITVATPAGDEPAVASADAAAGLLAAQRFRDQRAAEIARVTEARLRAGCACTAGLVVRGTLPELRDLATRPGVRSVQALPADAIAGRFAVAPLLPETVDVVTPIPDDGPVPAE
ncbi:hypothetical protein [Nocardia asteroides]|uniref:hypothetical protein n=1 Tax=Nocardia asteroides TaxID=1824 RepID=UPI001E2FCD49|nr:hypothetical protein [Nocardia asteroides]UGT54560.1 hypothetical protein LTT85_28700 [Nocardia asteroides]